MTPTTVDPEIVAAAANAGHWAELAGGGQVTEGIFDKNVAKLTELLDEGRTAQFNTLLLDPYLWKLHVGGQRLLQKARLAGAPFDGLVISAGIPELEDAVDIIEDLHEAGITHVVFKPGTVKQIRMVLAIAREVDTTVVMHIEGGVAGGHHSWEDLDELLLATYADLRSVDNLVVCVGGGIGTPDRAVDYLTGAWATSHGEAAMPVDGVLIGTAAMATKEATTSPAVKQLLVDTPGVPSVNGKVGWVGAGRSDGNITSGRSQLGADIHEIDNGASRAGRVLDEVAGDLEAALARKDELIEAMADTCKPYFGDVAEMTYEQWLRRYVELSGPGTTAPQHHSITGAGSEHWLDITFRNRFEEMLDRALARVHPETSGPIERLDVDLEEPDRRHRHARGGVPGGDQLRAAPRGRAVLPRDLPPTGQAGQLRARDRRRRTPLVEVRLAVAGPRRVLRSRPGDRHPRPGSGRRDHRGGRAGRRPARPVRGRGRRRTSAAHDALVLAATSRSTVGADTTLLDAAYAATDVVWGDRVVPNPLHRLQGTAATFVPEGDHAALLQVPLSRGELKLRVDLSGVADGKLPVISTDAATEAMGELLALTAGGTLPEVVDGTATVRATWSPDLVADHIGVTSPDRTRRGDAVADPEEQAVPDALVGLAWPAVFASIGAVEGLLDLVHLDHRIEMAAVVSSAARPRTSRADDHRHARRRRRHHGRPRDRRRRDHLDLRRRDRRHADRALHGPRTRRRRELAAPAPLATDAEEKPRARLDRFTVTAPHHMGAFAAVSGDHNPLHTDVPAARLAGFDGPIVHGMWLSAVAQRAAASVGATHHARPIRSWLTRWVSPLLPGAEVEITVERTGVIGGDIVVEVTCRADGELAMVASAVVAAPRTAYAFPGQGIQSQGMGLEARTRSAAARKVWDRADAHTREALGFSILAVVRDNPTELWADGELHRHPDGVLFLTQFTQVAMATLAVAQVAEMREAGVFVEGAITCGHSVGEYNALAAVTGILPLEALLEIVFRRGMAMHHLVPRDAHGRSNYRLAAIRPSQAGLADDDVAAFVEELAESSGEFIQIVNYNLRGSQYAIAGTVAGARGPRGRDRGAPRTPTTASRRSSWCRASTCRSTPRSCTPASTTSVSASTTCCPRRSTRRC